MKKKAGRPKFPEGKAKKRFNVRLNERQQQILFFNEGTESPQRALDNLIEQKERTLKVINNQFWKTLQDA
jgi:hypothetical protein